MSDYLQPIGAVLLPNLVGFAGGLIARNEFRPKTTGPNWFQSLKKPKLQPPSWLVKPVWLGLNCSMGYASYMVWRDGNGFDGKAALPLMCYGTQLALNSVWTPVFFKYHRLGLATVISGALSGAVLATLITFDEVNPTAAYLLMPYLAWVSFVTYINFSLWRNNKDRTD